jgi:hypothetical protein
MNATDLLWVDAAVTTGRDAAVVGTTVTSGDFPPGVRSEVSAE